MIPVEVIAELAELFDSFNNAFDPASAAARQAEEEFYARTNALHVAHAADIDFSVFRYELVSQCRQYLAKN